MREPVTARPESSNFGRNQDTPTYARSYVAMILSAILPGLGQLYLSQFVKGVIIFLIFASALALFYLNSLPVTEWSDLMRFKPVVQENTRGDNLGTDGAQQPYEIHIWTFDDGEKLMYRPSWKLKITSSIQAVLCWLYAVGDGWRGRRRTRIS
ncbi:hypothetical protein C6496_05135 [Candidatus Poribacteria bacterium]|nr:MAG: hypothetical protein C6496_05135 [Candidatus Poribacteria bacterium]